MKTISFNGLQVRKILTLVGYAAIVSGIMTALYTSFVLRPRVVRLTDELQTSIRQADKMAETVANPRLFTSAVNGVQASLNLVALLPESFLEMQKLLQKGSQATLSTGKTAEKAKEGVAGLVLPKKEVEKSTTDLKGTGEQMEVVATSMDKMKAASTDMKSHAGIFSEELEKAKPQILEGNGVGAIVHTRLQALDEAISNFGVSFQIIILGLGIAALFCFVGVISLALASAIHVES